MSRSFDLEDTLTTWLDSTAPEHAPGGLLDQVTVRTARTPQRPSWRRAATWIPAPFARWSRAATRLVLFVAVVLGLAIAMALAVATIGGPPRLPAPFGIAKPGLAISDVSGQIFKFGPDGSSLGRFTSSSDLEREPSWSHDGTRVAYWSAPAGTASTAKLWSLVVVNADGRQPKTLMSNVEIEVPVGVSVPQWSPDDERIAYVDTLGSDARIEYVAMDGSAPQALSTLEGPSFVTDTSGAVDPQWSPDGTQISYTSLSSTADGYSGGLRVATVVGGADRKLVDGPAAAGLRWSPDGTRLAYTDSNNGSMVDIMVIRFADGLKRPIATVEDMPMTISWSPDGLWLAFSRAGPNGIELHEVDGPGTRLLSAASLGMDGPAWSPDGTVLIGTKDGQLEMVDARGSRPSVPLEPALVSPAFGSNAAGSVSWQRLAP